MAGLFKKFSFGLKKSRDKMANAIDEMLDSFDTFEDDLFQWKTLEGDVYRTFQWKEH